MKSLLPWILAVALLGVAGFLFSSNRKLTSEVTTLRADAAHAQSLATELEQIKASGSPAQAETIAQLRKDNQDLLKLRNEVKQLRDGNKQLNQQVQQAQSQAQAAQSQVQTLSTNLQTAQFQTAQAQAAQQAFAQYVRTNATSPINACINNLRQLDGASQQWALENKKDSTATPTAQDIVPFLKGGVIPRCPSGGTYTLHTLAEAPTCSVPEHVLPQ